jgi:hypothetical protein
MDLNKLKSGIYLSNKLSNNKKIIISGTHNRLACL